MTKSKRTPNDMTAGQAADSVSDADEWVAATPPDDSSGRNPSAVPAGQASDVDRAISEQAGETGPDAGWKRQVQELQAELAAAQQRVLRAHAELENYRKRANRLLEEEKKYATLPLIRDLLPALDNLERAIQSAEQEGGGAGFGEGVKMVAQQLITVLEQHHCQRIQADGAVFDPYMHEAIAQFPHEHVPQGMVVEVTLPGYRLHDRVVRPSKVLVSSGPAENAEKQT